VGGLQTRIDMRRRSSEGFLRLGINGKIVLYLEVVYRVGGSNARRRKGIHLGKLEVYGVVKWADLKTKAQGFWKQK